MKNTVDDFKQWYTARSKREKIYVLVLGWALLYAIFSFLLFNPLSRDKQIANQDIRSTQQDIQVWQTQIAALKQIPKTSLYKKWLKHRQSLNALENQYKTSLKESSVKEWTSVIRAVLQSHPNITLVEMRNTPESVYHPSKVISTTKKLYQQSLEMTVYSNYEETLKYLQHLEKQLPNLHWDNLTYTVMQYPIAKVHMEFAIIYEKN